jgi:hypothetical protein
MCITQRLRSLVYDSTASLRLCMRKRLQASNCVTSTRNPTILAHRVCDFYEGEICKVSRAREIVAWLLLLEYLVLYSLLELERIE